MKCPLARGAPSSLVKRGDSGGCSEHSSRDLRAETAHVRAPGSLAMVMATPFLNGSVLDDGTVRTTYKGAKIDGTKATQLLVRCMLGSNAFLGWTVNSPHLRNPEKAAVTAASKLSWENQDKLCVLSRIRLSTMQVIGI